MIPAALLDLLSEIYPDWCDGLDGIYPAVTRKTADNEIEIIGLCCLLRDQDADTVASAPAT